MIACAEPAAGDCDAAVELVADCYGGVAAEAFAESCNADAAQAALADSCQTGDGGKADAFSTPILSPLSKQFKYGSIGADQLGLPKSILRAIPIVCADTLPAGADPLERPFEAFGLIYEKGHDLPIGFSTREMPFLGIELTGTTCSQCHTATVRETPTSDRVTFFGAPNGRFDVGAYSDFLLGCIADSDRFNASTLDDAFDQLDVGGFERLLAFKSGFIQEFTANLREQVGSVVTDGPWGPGRDDAIGLSAATLLGEEFLPKVPAPIDYPSVWNQAVRVGHALHWDGAAATALERNVLVAVGAGTPKDAVPLESIAAIQGFLDKLPPPAYPFAIDATLTARGEELYQVECAECHDVGGKLLWEVIPIEEVGTDPNRLDAVSPGGIDATNRLEGAGWEFSGFKKTDGYLASLLDGIWLRAPYLHNGSVPTLRDLLEPPANRPAVFFRGNDTYDAQRVGFVSDVEREDGRPFSRFDIARAGNGNGGHEYGTTLSSEDKDALVEYLKTL